MLDLHYQEMSLHQMNLQATHILVPFVLLQKNKADSISNSATYVGR